MPQRPLGIVLTALYSAASAVLSVVVSLLGFIGAGLVSQASAGWVGLLGTAALILGIASAASAYGLWTRQSWAPRVTLYIYAVSIVLGVLALFYDQSPGNIVVQLVGIAIAMLIVVYIRRPEVVALFSESGSAPPHV